MATKSILVVEPDASISEFLSLILSEEDYEVARASSLAEATALLSATHFDLIITEALSQSDAFRFDPAFLIQLRTTAGDTPIILCSTYASTCVITPPGSGLAGVLPKPFEIDDLQDKIISILGRMEPPPGGQPPEDAPRLGSRRRAA